MINPTTGTNQHGIEPRADYTPALILAPLPGTMKIASDDVESGFVIINTEDFDKATMKEYVAAKVSEKAK